MSDRNYWTTLRQRKISRRTMLGASAKAGVGAAGLALVGCGGDDDDAAPAAVDTSAIDAAAGDASAAASAAGEASAAASEASAAASEAAAAASQAADAADAAAALAAEAAESEDAANAAAAAEAAAAAAAQAADAAGAAGDAAGAAVADAAAQAAEAAAQAARDAAAAVEAGTATAAAAQAAIDNAAADAAAAAAAAGEASAAAGQAAATAAETAATAEAVAEAAAETAAAAVAAAEEAADAAREAAESAAMAAAEPEGPAAGETDFDATVRITIAQAAGGTDPMGPGSNQPQAWMLRDSLGQFDQFSNELVARAGTFEWIDDFTAALVHVKPGMTFHDGAPVTAADIKFSFDRQGGIGLYNPDGKFDSRATYVTGAIRDEVTVVDELTAHVPLNTDASAFASLAILGIVPKHLIEEIGDEAYNNFAVASGPFKLVSYDPADQVTSIRFEDYHVEAGSTHRVHKPYIKKLQQIVRPEPLSHVAALEADEADMSLILPPDLAETFLDSDDFSVLYLGGVDNWNITMNTLRPLADGSTPFQDIRVRRAMNHAVNWDAIIDSLTGGEQRAYGIASSSIGAMTDEQKAGRTYEYNPDKARALLAEAGYADGFHTPFWVHIGYLPGTEDAGLAIQQDLEAVGITSDLQADVHAVFRPRLGAIGDDGIHEAPGLHFYFVNHFADPVSNINAYFDENGSIAHAQYPGSGIQELVEAQRTAFDPAERERLINELAVAIYENASYLFGIEPVGTGVLRNNLEWINYASRQDHFNYWGIRPMFT